MKKISLLILDLFSNDENLIINTREDLLMLNLLKYYERKFIYSLNLTNSDYDYVRESMEKKHRAQEIV